MIINNYNSKCSIQTRIYDAPIVFSAAWRILNLSKNRYTSLELKDKIKKLEMKQTRYISNIEYLVWISKNYIFGKVPLFSSIEIETINRCNGSCSFCPVNKKDDPRKMKKMKEENFYKIIDNLKELDYRGRVALHSNNEPFLDTRIIEFAKYAREKLPKAFIYLYTNGSIVTLDKFLNIMNYLDKMYFDNYNDELKLCKNASIIHEYCKKDRKMDKRVEIHLRKLNEVLSTRGGQSPNNQKREVMHLSCILPFKQMVVRPDGKCSLCCNDALGKYTMGDIEKNSLKEIWYGERYNKLRKVLIKGRKNVSICRYCDTLPEVNQY